jgi:hypothetical protein
VTSTDVKVDAGDGIELSGVNAAEVEVDSVKVTTASGLTAEVGTETSIVSKDLNVDVLDGARVSTDDLVIEAAGTMSVSGEESLSVTARTTTLDTAQDATIRMPATPRWRSATPRAFPARRR